MLDVTFKIDGRRMRDLGLELQSPLTLSAPKPRVSTVKIPGRNGDLHYYDGSYDNRDLSGDCFILGADVIRKINEINAFLLGKRGYRRIELDEDEEHFMLGRCETGLSYRIVKGILTACSVSFDVKPQRFLKYGEKEVDVTESKEIRNPSAFISLPVIAVEGAGNVTVSSGEWSLNIKNLSGKVVYDAEMLCAYSEAFNQNYHTAVSGNVVLSPGVNTFKVTGNVSAVKIIPRWWEL
jgi:phage-related protein